MSLLDEDQILNHRILSALNKLQEYDTQQIGTHELNDLIETALISTDERCAAYARRESVMFLGQLAVRFRDQFSPHLQRALSYINHRLRDHENTVQVACADALGLIVSSVRVYGADDDSDSSLGVFLKPLFSAMHENHPDVQQYSALCVARIISSTTSERLSKNLSRLLQRLTKLLSHATVSFGHPNLLLAIANAAEVAKTEMIPYTPSLMTALFNSLASPEWTTRRAAATTLQALAEVMPNAMLQYRDEVVHVLEDCRLDKMRPVRETVIECLKIYRALDGAKTPKSRPRVDWTDNKRQPSNIDSLRSTTKVLPETPYRPSEKLQDTPSRSRMTLLEYVAHKSSLSSQPRDTVLNMTDLSRDDDEALARSISPATETSYVTPKPAVHRPAAPRVTERNASPVVSPSAASPTAVQEPEQPIVQPATPPAVQQQVQQPTAQQQVQQPATQPAVQQVQPATQQQVQQPATQQQAQPTAQQPIVQPLQQQPLQDLSTSGPLHYPYMPYPYYYPPYGMMPPFAAGQQPYAAGQQPFAAGQQPYPVQQFAPMGYPPAMASSMMQQQPTTTTAAQQNSLMTSQPAALSVSQPASEASSHTRTSPVTPVSSPSRPLPSTTVPAVTLDDLSTQMQTLSSTVHAFMTQTEAVIRKLDRRLASLEKRMTNGNEYST